VPYTEGPLDFTVPAIRADQTWDPVIDTYAPSGIPVPGQLTAGDHITVHPRSIVLLQAPQRGSHPEG
jgi:glycogen operon protein